MNIDMSVSGVEKGGVAVDGTTPNMLDRHQRCRLVIVAFTFILIGLSSAVLGWLLALVATFRGIYASAGIRMPVLIDIAGHYPWPLISVVVLFEVIFTLLAWRSRRPGLWLTVEALALAGLIFLLISIFQGNIYRPIFDLDSVIQSGK